jgi:hypothetical protein
MYNDAVNIETLERQKIGFMNDEFGGIWKQAIVA